MRRGGAGVRAELHLHSRASTDTGSWFLNRSVIPESYTQPITAYRVAKAKGMDFVALTDHNTLAGVSEIAHLPDVIVGVEVTTQFPDDGALMHVLVWGVDDTSWREIDRLRGNVYEMTAFLRASRLPHALAHPLHRVGDRFDAEHLERSLLIFSLWEGLNGARPEINNDVASRIARSATPEYLAKLAEKHGIEPVNGGRIGLTGGSDDHNMFDIANAWTELPRARTVEDVLAHLRAGRTEPGGLHGNNHTVAHTAASVFVKAHMDAGASAIPPALHGFVADLMGYDAPLPEVEEVGAGSVSESGQTFAQEVMRKLRKDPGLVRRYRRYGKGMRRNERLRLVTGWLHDDLIGTTFGEDAGPLSTSFPRRMNSFVGAAAMAMPYVLAAAYHRGERAYTETIEREFFGARPERPPRALMLTDTYDELNGVAGTMRRLARFAAEDPSERITVVTSGRKDEERPGLRRLRAVASFEMPAYGDPDWRLGIPSVLEMLDFVEARQADVIHAATPGPMGLVGLLVARALGLPFVASYHTELARYALELTGDRLVARLCGQGTAWFYRQAERVYVPTRSTEDGLVSAGIPRGRIVRFSRGTDTALFDPSRRSERTRRRMGAGRRTILLYVGRISREKGVLLLAEAFRRASSLNPDLVLAVVGEGPGERLLADALAGTPHHLLGPQTGVELATSFASSDIFCLPSETETFGQVAVEAAASGLPVITLDKGAARERVRDGETGIVVPAANPLALATAIATLADDPELRGRMGRAARAHAESSAGWNEVFESLASSYREVRRADSPSLLDIGLQGTGPA